MGMLRILLRSHTTTQHGARCRRTVRIIRNIHHRIRHIKLTGAAVVRIISNIHRRFRRVIKNTATAFYIPNPGGYTRGQMEEEEDIV